MTIKKMTYESVSGGTLTIYTDEILKETIIDVPSKMNDLITLLEKRIGEPIENITFQLSHSQHISEERVVINYKLNPKTFETDKIIINVSDFDFYEKLRYGQMKTELKIN
jgi:hypothetical protein